MLTRRHWLSCCGPIAPDAADNLATSRMAGSTDVITASPNIALQSPFMELKHLVQKFVYRIEPKPEGGFIARAADPTVPPLEAPTREELQQKIQAKIVEGLSTAFPGLKLPALQNQQLKWDVHIDRKPGGGFTVHSERPGTPTGEPATQEKIDHFAEELLGFVDKHFPDLSQALAAQVGGRDIKVFTTEQSSVTLQGNSLLGGAKGLLPTQPMQAADLKNEYATVKTTTTENANINSAAFANTPITPEASGNWKLFRFLLLIATIAALLYFFVVRR